MERSIQVKDRSSGLGPQKVKLGRFNPFVVFVAVYYALLGRR